MSNEKEPLNIDPNILLNSIDSIDILVQANVKILETVRSIIKNCIDSGMDQDTAASVAIAIQQYAAEKSKNLVSYEEGEANGAKTDN